MPSWNQTHILIVFFLNIFGSSGILKYIEFKAYILFTENLDIMSMKHPDGYRYSAH